MQQSIRPKLGILAALALAGSNIFSGGALAGLASDIKGGYKKPHKSHKPAGKKRKHKKVYAKHTRGY